MKAGERLDLQVQDGRWVLWRVRLTEGEVESLAKDRKVTIKRTVPPHLPGRKYSLSLTGPQGRFSSASAALAVEKAGSTDRVKVRDALREIANAPGEKILPGEWKKAKELLAAGKDIDYSGATGEMEFDANGDIPGVIGHFVVDGTGYKQVGLVTP